MLEARALVLEADGRPLTEAMLAMRKSKRGLGVRALIPDLADVLRAELDQATTLLRQLEGMLTRTGGYMTPEDQIALRSARAFLVDRAK